MNSDKNYRITGTALKQVVLKFIPSQFIKDVDLSKLGFDNPEVLSDGGVGLLKKLMDKATDDLRIYDNAEMLADDLQKYRRFTSSHRYFEIDLTNWYNAPPIILFNEKGEKFICKQDQFVRFQNAADVHMEDIFCENEFRDRLNFLKKDQTVFSLIMIYLKTCEARLAGCCEYVSFYEDFLQRLQNYWISARDSAIKEEITTRLSLDDSFDEMFEKWNRWLPEWTDEQLEPIRNILKIHFDQYPLADHFRNWETIFAVCGLYFKWFQCAIDSQPEFYRPATPESIKCVPLTLRIFQDSKLAFVMKAELFKALNLGGHKFDYKDPDGFLEVMSFHDLHQEYSDLTSKIEFLNVPQRLSAGKPTPIMTPTGGYCIHGSEAVQQIFYYLTRVLKVFQKIKKDSWNLVEKYMEWLGDELRINMKNPHFITLEKYECIEKYTFDFFKEFESIPAKSVRNVRKVGFKTDDIRKELKYLGLTDTLPGIENQSEGIYTAVVKCKSTRFLTTRDMMNSIEQCQLVYFLERFKNIRDGNYEVEERPEPQDQSSKCSENDDAFLKQEIKELEARVDALITVNEQFRLSYAQIKEENHILLKKLSTLTNTVNDYEELKSKLTKNEESEVKVKESNRKLTDKNQQLTKTVTKLENQLKNANRIAKESELKLEGLKDVKELEDQIEKLDDSKRQLESKLKNEEKLQEINRKLSDAHKNLIIQNTNLKFQLETQKQKTQSAILAVEHQKKDSKRKMGALQLKVDKDMAEAAIEIKKQEAELKRVTESQNIAQLESKLVEKNSEVEKLTEKYEEMKNLRQLDDMKNRNLEGLTASLKRTILNHEVTENGLRTRNQQLEAQLERVTESQSIAQLESKLAQKNSEVEKLTEKYEEMKNLRQLDDMKTRNLEGLTASLKRTILNHEVTENGLRTRNQQLEAQLENEKQKTQELAEGVVPHLHRIAGGIIDSDLEKETLENKLVINEFQTKIRELTAQNEQQNMMIKSFFHHFGPVQSSYSSSFTQTTLSEYSSSQLVNLQKIRDSSGIPLELAKTVVDRLISMSTQPEVHEMAKYEYEQYESQTHNYLQSVESMIAQIRNTGECIHSLPNHPSFSDRFINQYWDGIKKSGEGGLEDDECFYCYYKMESNQKTLECTGCRKVTHLECASKWLRVNRTCPNCRREQLDPNEFPPLA